MNCGDCGRDVADCGCHAPRWRYAGLTCRCGARVPRFFGTGMTSRVPVCEDCYRREDRAYVLGRHAKDQSGAA